MIYYFLFRKHGGGGGCLGGLNQIKQPRVADFFFAYPLVGGEKCPYGYATHKRLRMEKTHKHLKGEKTC